MRVPYYDAKFVNGCSTFICSMTQKTCMLYTFVHLIVEGGRDYQIRA